MYSAHNLTAFLAALLLVSSALSKVIDVKGAPCNPNSLCCGIIDIDGNCISVSGPDDMFNNQAVVEERRKYCPPGYAMCNDGQCMEGLAGTEGRCSREVGFKYGFDLCDTDAFLDALECTSTDTREAERSGVCNSFTTCAMECETRIDLQLSSTDDPNLYYCKDNAVTHCGVGMAMCVGGACVPHDWMCSVFGGGSVAISSELCEGDDFPDSDSVQERCERGPKETGGRCETLPADHVCAEWIGTKDEVFMFGDYSVVEQAWHKHSRIPYRPGVARLTWASEPFAQGFLSSACNAIYAEYQCRVAFPKCEKFPSSDGNLRAVPIPQCLDVCEEAIKHCGSVFAFGASVLNGINLGPVCDSVITEADNVWDDLTELHLDAFVGKPRFMSPEVSALGGYNLTFFDGATVTGVGCDALIRDNAIRECVPQMCPTPFVSVEKEPLGECIFLCEMPCPLPLWPTASSWDGLLQAHIIPGLLSLPLNLVVFWAAVRDQVTKKKIVPVRFFESVAAFWALLYVAMTTLPATALSYSTGCAGKVSYSYEEFWTYVVPGSACNLATASTFVLQAMLLSTMWMLHLVRTSLMDAAAMKRSKVHLSKQVIPGLVLCVLLPVVLMVPALVTSSARLDEQLTRAGMATEEFGTPMNSEGYWMRRRNMENLARNVFTCDPTHLTPVEELLYLHLPLLVFGIVCVGLSISAINVLSQWQWKNKMTAAGVTGPKMRNGKKRKKSKSEMILGQVARSLARFSAAAALFLIMELISAALFLPQLVDLADNLGRWYDCSYDGALSVGVIVDNSRFENTDLQVDVDCSEYADFSVYIPDHTLLLAFFLSRSMLPLLLGVSFAWKPLSKVLLSKKARKAAGIESSIESSTSTSTPESWKGRFARAISVARPSSADRAKSQKHTSSTSSSTSKSGRAQSSAGSEGDVYVEEASFVRTSLQSSEREVIEASFTRTSLVNRGRTQYSNSLSSSMENESLGLEMKGYPLPPTSEEQTRKVSVSITSNPMATPPSPKEDPMV